MNSEVNIIKSLTPYVDRRGRRGGRRAAKPRGDIAVGIYLGGTEIVYRTPGGQLRRASGSRVQLSSLIPAEECRTFVAWQGLLGRCYQPTNASYGAYGGRGVGVAEAWRAGGREVYGGTLDQRREAFRKFRLWVFERVGRDLEAGEEISRYYDLGNYCPENCEVLTRAKHAEVQRLYRKAAWIAEQIIPTDRGRPVVLRRPRFIRMLASGGRLKEALSHGL